MKKLFFALTGLFFFATGMAQQGFMDGYIITLKGDTVNGKIKDRKDPDNVVSRQKILFSGQNGIEKFSPDELRGYVKADSSFYHVLVLGIEERRKFVRVIEQKDVILYADITGALLANAKVGTNPFEGDFIYAGIVKRTKRILGHFYLQKKNDPGSLMEWRTRDYKTTAGYFFGKDTTLLQEIQNDKLKYQDVQTMVRKFEVKTQ